MRSPDRRRVQTGRLLQRAESMPSGPGATPNRSRRGQYRHACWCDTSHWTRDAARRRYPPCTTTPSRHRDHSHVPPRLIAFAEFIARARSASLADFGRGGDCRVRDAAAFAEMRAHLLERYREAVVVRSLLIDGQTFDCVAGPGGVAVPSGEEMGCPAGSIPVRRITLEEMVRFETLRDFLRKAPGSGPPQVIGGDEPRQHP
jgi:hypothetical protein